MGVRIVGLLLPSCFRELSQKKKKKERTSITCELCSRLLQARAGKFLFWLQKEIPVETKTGLASLEQDTGGKTSPFLRFLE